MDFTARNVYQITTVMPWPCQKEIAQPVIATPRELSQSTACPVTLRMDSVPVRTTWWVSSVTPVKPATGTSTLEQAVRTVTVMLWGHLAMSVTRSRVSASVVQA